MDIGYRNCALAQYDGDTLTMFHIDLMKKPTYAECYAFAENFCTTNTKLLMSIKQFALEDQRRSLVVFKNIQEAFLVTLAKLYPTLPVYVVSPRTTRAYFNISVAKAPGKGSYIKRKQLSIKKLTEIMPPERLRAAQRIFPKLDDIADAALLAIYVHKNGIKKRRASLKKVPRVLQLSFHPVLN